VTNFPSKRVFFINEKAAAFKGGGAARRKTAA
jgi:hypothetical protein